MKLYDFIKKALLITVLPFAFVFVTSVVIAGILGSLGALMGHNTFIHCFQSILNSGMLVVVMSITAVIGTLYYLSEQV